MKYDINTVIKDLDENSIEFEGKLLTYADALYRIAVTPHPDPRATAPQDQQYEMYTIASKIKRAARREGALNLTPKEAEALRVIIPRAWGVVVSGRVQDFLNGAPATPAE
jgi:hypothetical protein